MKDIQKLGNNKYLLEIDSSQLLYLIGLLKKQQGEQTFRLCCKTITHQGKEAVPFLFLSQLNDDLLQCLEKAGFGMIEEKVKENKERHAEE